MPTEPISLRKRSSGSDYELDKTWTDSLRKRSRHLKVAPIDRDNGVCLHEDVLIVYPSSGNAPKSYVELLPNNSHNELFVVLLGLRIRFHPLHPLPQQRWLLLYQEVLYFAIARDTYFHTLTTLTSL
ncbi:hypothetical protein EVAR_86775_1 [Eumeta japonica]|uniref:Uncharacterized protein n=1 Tax=Eumeta variegata TaxID=151549 RepID=A0A4C1W0E2_EUMVA|nr:hypothetical protein EVAR_86775_1 [Eumeta japonica]